MMDLCRAARQPLESDPSTLEPSEALDGFYRFDFRHIMANQAFDAALQRDGRRRTSRTGAMHRQIESPAAIASVRDVSAVLRDSRADPGLDQFLDLLDDIAIGRVFLETVGFGDLDARRAALREQRRPTDEMVQQRFDHQRFKVAPGHARRRGDGYEIR